MFELIVIGHDEQDKTQRACLSLIDRSRENLVDVADAVTRTGFSGTERVI